MTTKESTVPFRRAAAILVLLIVVACSDGITGVAPSKAVSPSPSASIDVAAVDAQLQQLARGVAIALMDSAARYELRDAWRASVVTEHKLILQDYLARQAGARLRQQLAVAMNETTAALDLRTSRLPRLDFFVPFQEHRTTWRGTSDLTIGATIQRHHAPILRIYAADGLPSDIARASGVPKHSLALLAPAEPSSLRINPQPTSRGSVIQEPNDGTESGADRVQF